MCPFYSRKGDEGQTGLLGKKRVFKDDDVIELIGNLDELSSTIGLAKNVTTHLQIKEALAHIQGDLFHIMSEAAAVDESRQRFQFTSDSQIDWLEKAISQIETKINIPTYFILPGDSLPAAHLDQARTVSRRCERRAVSLARNNGLSNGLILKYLNRLSSLIFALELFELNQSGITPTPVHKEK